VKAVLSRSPWSEFLQPQADTRLLAVLRVGYASLILVHWLVFLPDVEMLWSDQGVLPLSQLSAVVSGFVPTLFYLLPRSTTVVWIAYGLLGIHAALLFLGYRTRLQAAAVLVWLVSFQNRNPLLLNGQDAVLRLIGFWLLLLPIGNAFSLDAATRRRATAARREPLAASTVNAWPLRLLQVQVALVMLAAGIWKLRGDDWIDGTALYYVTRLDGFWGNFPVPSALSSSAPLLRILTYLTLAIELLVPILIWVPTLRRIALVTAIGFHLALAYTMNLFLFEWIMILGWSAFLRPDDFTFVAGVYRDIATSSRARWSSVKKEDRMKKAIGSMLMGAAILTIAMGAHAATEPSADETYLPGPGGGDVWSDGGDGTPPLESTGLEDGIGGSCDCSLTGRSRAGSLAGSLALLAIGVFVVRRQSSRRLRVRL
jgi:hypothetical protein